MPSIICEGVLLPWSVRDVPAVLEGAISGETHLMVVTSEMAENGTIFSDGVEADFLSFTAGLTARISIAPKKANLIVPAARA